MTDLGAEKEWMCRKDDDSWWQNRGLDKILTNFVRNQVRGRQYNDREYIDELMDIEMYCIRGVGSSGDAMNLTRLRKKYPLEYQAIMTELDPEWKNDVDESAAEWERWLKDDEAIRAREDQERLQRAQQDRRIWQELGGKPLMTWARAMYEFGVKQSEEERKRTLEEESKKKAESKRLDRQRE
jgi:hypothetical protein